MTYCVKCPWQGAPIREEYHDKYIKDHEFTPLKLSARARSWLENNKDLPDDLKDELVHVIEKQEKEKVEG